MKKAFNTLLGWFSSWQAAAARAGTAQTLPPMPEHERRLGELQQSGRMVFLP
jgi:hypothetical protein